MAARKTEQLENRYREKRYQQFDNGQLNIKRLVGHRVANRILIRLITLQRILRKEKLIVVGDRRIKTKRPVIFLPMHIGGSDIEVIFESVRTHTWLMLGDPREMYCNVSGAMLHINGVIWFDTAYKKDRHIAKLRSIELLKRGENIIIFPEGAYNISPNRLVMYPYTGAAEIAITTHADIIPIGLVRQGKTYYINIGENISTEIYNTEQKYELTELLRNHLATLCWEILEKLPIVYRKTLKNDYYENDFLKKMFIQEGFSYTVDDVKKTLYRPKGIDGIEFKEKIIIDDF